ncbi:MAG: copper chaperone PCu(A)C [Nevskiales bacterium]|nr:copper chaperone PCu(A)C [Nevskiales bacterium]
MKFPSKIAAAAALAALLAAHTASAGSPGATEAPELRTASPLRISDAWVRATPPGAQVAAGYMTIRNTGPAPLRVTGARSDRAGKVQIHSMTMADGQMRMREVPDGLAIAPGAQVTLAPGGLHLMLMQLDGPIADGETVAIDLLLDDGSTLALQLPARRSPPAAP